MAGTGDEEMQDADGDGGGESWKQVLDRKLHRLHSLFFGLEAAMERQHWEIALGLGLRLLGFLESQSVTEEDRIYIHPIRKSVLHQIDIAKENHYKIIEKKALEHAGCGRTPTFGSNHPVDIAKIASSRFFKPFISQDRFGTSKNITESVVSSKDDASNIESSRRPINRNAQASVGADRIRGRNIHKSLREENMETIRPEPEKRTPARRPPLHVLLPSASGQPNDEEEPTKPPAFATAKRKWAVKRSAISEDDEEDAPRPRAGFNAKQKSVKYWTNKMETDEEEDAKPISFLTAKQKLAVDSVKRTGSLGSNSKTLGTVRRAVRGSFISPVRSASAANAEVPDSTMKCMELLAGPDGELPDKLRNLELQLLEHISNEIMEKDSNVCWEDIAGLDHAKKCVTEMVIWPLIRPDLFHGCRSPGKGLLLFGPPGTGKTMIGKAIAGQAKATFFSISASSLTSKWIGEGEKLVRALFGVASCLQPAVIFIDEVDSLLSQRKSEGEHESSRRIKTQFLIEMEGIGSGNEQLLLIGATNRPQELDEAARRRFSKRLYIPLPSSEARGWIVRNLLQKDGLLALSSEDIEGICSFTEGYSGSDMKNLVKEASMFPLREALKAGTDISKISNEHMRPIVLEDFRGALQHVKPSVSKSELGAYEEWNLQFGSLS